MTAALFEPRARRRAACSVGLSVAVALVAAGCQRPGHGAAPAEGGATAAPPASAVFAPSPIAAGERQPLVIFLHGLGGSGAQLFRYMNLEQLGRARRIFVVAPEGGRDRSGRQFWNAGPACCDIDHAEVDDVARLAALIDWWRARPSIDPRRIYVVGFSNGGFMAHRLACAIGERLAAVASIAGAGPGPREPCPVSSAVGVLEVHGDADGVVRYDGGRVFDEPALAPYPAAPVAMQAWARRLGCGERPLALAPAPAEETSGASHRTARYPNCARGGVELWTIPGGDHRMPSPAVVDEIWSFLSRWIKPGV